MARCPDCNKFTGKNVDEDPEITDGPDTDVSEGLLTVTLTAKIHNDCEECSTELEETEIELSGQLDASDHTEDGHGFTVEEDDVELSRTDSGGGRYAKRMFGVEGTAKARCDCGEEFTVDLKGDAVASSQMESLI